MELVSCYKAAKIAGVSPSAITDMKRKNDKDWGKYPFFVYNPQIEKVMVDIQSNDWLGYIERNKDNPAKKKEQKSDTKQNPGKSDGDNYVDVMTILTAVEESIVEVLNLPESKTNKVLQMIIEKYSNSRA